MIFLPPSLLFRSSYSRNSNWYGGPVPSGPTRCSILVMEDGLAPGIAKGWMEAVKKEQYANKKWWQFWIKEQ